MNHESHSAVNCEFVGFNVYNNTTKITQQLRQRTPSRENRPLPSKTHPSPQQHFTVAKENQLSRKSSRYSYYVQYLMTLCFHNTVVPWVTLTPVTVLTVYVN